MITIRQAQAADEHQWNGYVKKHPMHSPYHLFHWQIAVKDAYQHEACYLIAEENNTLVGIFPMVIFLSPFGRKNLCALPFCDVGGILADNDTIKQLLLEKSKELARQHKAAKLELRSGVDSAASTAVTDIGKSNEKVRMLMPLPNSSEILFFSNVCISARLFSFNGRSSASFHIWLQ